MPIDKAVLLAIQQKTSPDTLDLSNKELKNQDVISLANLLAGNPGITALNLRDNQIEAEGAKALSKVASLKSLALHPGNNIGVVGLKAFLNTSLIFFPIKGGSGEVVKKIRDRIATNQSLEEKVVPKKVKEEKTVVKKTSHSKKTIRTTKSSFEQNITCSLALPDSLSKTIEEHEEKRQHFQTSNKVDDAANSVLEAVKLVKDNIIEHAARRVDLFFLLLVAVYGKNWVVTKTDTTAEHGCGKADRGTHACHSSLFPAVTLASEERQTRSEEKEITDFSYLFLSDSLNSTVELPEVVNGFDGHLEGRRKPSKWTTESQNILNKVSKGTLNPTEGIDEFLGVMHRFFSSNKKSYFKKSGVKTPGIAKQQVCEYEKEGTFLAADEKHKIKPAYINMMLRLNTKEIKEVNDNPGMLASKYYPLIQKEIFNAPSFAYSKKSK